MLSVFLYAFISNNFAQIFKDTTLFFSRGTPNLATVIPAMDHIDRVLATSSNTPSKFSPAICAALAVGKNVINKYYNKTDYSEVYHIAMGTFFSESLGFGKSGSPRVRQTLNNIT